MMPYLFLSCSRFSIIADAWLEPNEAWSWSVRVDRFFVIPSKATDVELERH